MHIPRATYRVQLNAHFGFRQLAQILDYLNDLGISDIYASPVFRARPGSTHGYDVLDPNWFNPELGSEQDWQALTDRRRALHLGWLQDIVPNHTAYSGLNPKVAELFEKGPDSALGFYFDIRWDHPRPELHGRVMAPFLGAPLMQCFDTGRITLQFDETGLCLSYYEHRFPLALKSYAFVFGAAGKPSTEAHQSPETNAWFDTVAQLAYWTETEQKSVKILKEELWKLYGSSAEIQRVVNRRLRAFNSSGWSVLLEKLLNLQYFQLTPWRTAARCINYRRFFSINELIGVRQEDRRVFALTHTLVARLAHSDVFTGLRVDHVDGLLAPGLYLQWLREACGDRYLLVEKITARDEKVPDDWPVQGSTGYEFGAHLDRLFTYAQAEPALNAAYETFCGPQAGFETVARASKTQVLDQEFSGDLDNLADRFAALPECGGLAWQQLRAALAQLLINVPVYRTYLSHGPRCESDRVTLSRATILAAGQRQDLRACLHRLENLFLAANMASHTVPAEDPYSRVIGAFEQFCAALAAKGVEDTALYRYLRFTALNEVGGEPQLFGESRRAFHDFLQERAVRCPHSLNSLSTHDSKRGADVRARLLVLSEMAVAWTARVQSWAKMNHALEQETEKGRRPDLATQYLLYQTLLGTWPVGATIWTTYVARIRDYMLKAVREAKIHTSWVEPDAAYEEALTRFIDAILTADSAQAFRDDLSLFARHAACYGMMNILARTLVQLTAPGIPDIYQGNELNDDSLVDPDNRRPVDYEKRRRALARILRDHPCDPGQLTADLLADGDYDAIKLYVVFCGLQARHSHPDLFAGGAYRPLSIEGTRGFHALAFARALDGEWCITVVPRFLSRISTPETMADSAALWRDTHIKLTAEAPRQWRDAFTHAIFSARGGRLSLADLLSRFPVALLSSED